MPQGAGSFSLCFATVYQSAIRPYSSKNQRETINTLFLGKGVTTLTDASCSNYANGKRAVPDDFRSRLANLSEAELDDLLSAIGIHECDRMAETLVLLIELCSIPKTQRKKLIDLSRKPKTIAFIKAVLRAAADDKDAHPLDAIAVGQLKALSMKSKAADAAAALELLSEPSEPEDELEPDPPDEDISWMNDFLPRKMEAGKRSFFGTPLSINQQLLTMPDDLPALLYLLNPMVKGDPIDDFTINDFIELMHINIGTGKADGGSLQCFKISGPAKSICKCIELLNLSDVSDVAFLMAGHVTNRDAKAIVKSIHAASNDNIRCLRAMWFDESIPEVEVTLIIRFCPDDAFEQKSYTTDEDGVKIAPIRRKASS